ncbi:M20/M25/M40 family metallo-hydrolase [Allomuricauda sp. d1]|uniref:M20/M25/M40 family metallo-hydrolase n=1 Tax=Allomuricauda sp. d1 TaxID=3136725 RepID=UPI0031D3CA2F
MKIRFLLLVFVVIWATGLHFGHSQKPSRKKIEKWSEKALPTAIGELVNFMAIANDGNYPEQIEENLNWCKVVFAELDFETKILETDGAPLLYAESKNHNTDKSILFYLQIDGQPVDTLAWNQPNPYKAVFKHRTAENEWNMLPKDFQKSGFNMDWRIFGRSASDSKGPAIAFINALRILKEKNIIVPYTVKVIMDFQEELGSPSLPAAVNRYRELLEANAILVMDGTRHLSNLPTLTFGARGIATATIRVFGPRKALHSGQYGNVAPNPVFEASRLLTSLKDEDGRVAIPSFYDGISLNEDEKRRLNAVPEDLEQIKKRLGIAQIEAIGETYQEALQYPTLNVRGLNAAWVGKEVRTLIPEEVVIEIDMRLVPESDGERLMQLLRKHIIGQGFHLADSIPTDKERAEHRKLASFKYRLGSKPFRTSFDAPIASMLNHAMQRIFDDRFIAMRTTGGSQPIAPFINTLEVDAVSVRIPNPDNSIHAPNENLRIGNFLEGIMTNLSILTEPFDSKLPQGRPTWH